MSAKINNPKFLVLNAIMDCGKKLEGLHKLILCRLISYGNFNREKNIIDNIYPSIETVATKLGVAENTVRAAIKAATKLKILSSFVAYDEKGRQTSNDIVIYVDMILSVLSVDKAVNNPVKNNVKQNLGVQPLGGSGVQPLVRTGVQLLKPTITEDPIREKEHYVMSDTIKNLYKKTEQSVLEYIVQALSGIGYTGAQLRIYTDEVLFHGHTRDTNKTKSFNHAINAALKAIREGRWTTPRLMLKINNNK